MSRTLPIKPESRAELENIVKVSEYSVKFGAEKEQIAREAVEKNGFDFLCAGRNPVGFVFYEFTKGEMLLQAKREKESEEKKRKRMTKIIIITETRTIGTTAQSRFRTSSTTWRRTI